MTVNRRVLIAEDHEEVADALREALETAGHEAIASSTFEQARGMLQRQGLTYL